MNSNKNLIILSCLLILFLIIYVFSRTRSNRYEYISTDNELFITNISAVPDIIRNFENVKDIYGKKNTLIFRLVNTSCNICLNKLLKELLNFQEELGKENILIFPAYPNDRISRIQLSADLEKFNYLNIPRDSLLIPVVDGEEKSYFAWINKEGEIDMVFLPDKDKPQQTRRYFQEVKKLINETKQ